jgi:hypothetical protein
MIETIEEEILVYIDDINYKNYLNYINYKFI